MLKNTHKADLKYLKLNQNFGQRKLLSAFLRDNLIIFSTDTFWVVTSWGIRRGKGVEGKEGENWGMGKGWKREKGEREKCGKEGKKNGKMNNRGKRGKRRERSKRGKVGKEVNG